MTRARGPVLSFFLLLLSVAVFLTLRGMREARIPPQGAASSRLPPPAPGPDGGPSLPVHPAPSFPPPLAPSPVPSPPTAEHDGSPGEREAEVDFAGWLLRAETLFAERRIGNSLDEVDRIARHPRASPETLFRTIQLSFWMKAYVQAAALADLYRGRFELPKETAGVELMAQAYADAHQYRRSVDLWAYLYRTRPAEELQRRALSAAAALEPEGRAIELHRNYLERFPEDAGLRERLMRLYQAKGDLVRYAAELETILKQVPDRRDLRSELVALYTAEASYEALTPHLEFLIREGKADPDVEDLYLRVLDMTGREADLERELRRRLAEDPSNVKLLGDLGSVVLSDRRFGEAARIWGRLFELDNQDLSQGIRAAAAAEYDARWDDARKIYRQLHQRLPGAKEWGDKLAELHDVRYEQELADLLRKRDKPAQAKELALHSLTHDPSDPEMLRLVGSVAFDDGELVEAEKHFRRLVEIDPDNIDDVFMLNECYAGLEDKPRMQSTARMLVALLPTTAPGPHRDYLEVMGILRMGSEKEAYEKLRILVRTDPDNTEMMGTYGSLLLKARNYEDLDELLGRWRRLKPNLDEIHVLAGLSLKDRGFLEEAAAELRPAPGVPASTERVLEYARILVELGRWKEAHSLLQEEESRDPRLVELRERIDASYGPESSGLVSTYAAKGEHHWRADQTAKAFVGERVWVAEKADYAEYRGVVPRLGPGQTASLAEGQILLGAFLTPTLQAWASGGAWEVTPDTHPTGSVGVDWREAHYSATLEVDGHRPWDPLVETVIFEGQEDRIEAGGELDLDPVTILASGRYSQYETLLGRGILGRRFGDEEAVLTRIEAALWSDPERMMGQGFWDETLRHERHRFANVSLVYQFSFSEYLGDPEHLLTIPLIRRSTTHLAGVTATWIEGNTLLFSGEYLDGLDPARGLTLGKVVEATARASIVLSKKAFLDASMSYLSEQLIKAGGGRTWTFQLSINLNF
jgi:tetratricopeptide (TPR) repeat protein